MAEGWREKWKGGERRMLIDDNGDEKDKSKDSR